MQSDFPEIRSDKFSEGEILCKSEFARSAVARAHPLEEAATAASNDLPADLTAAIDFIIDKGSSIIQIRDDRRSLLRDIASALEPPP
jgi:hypothetical protein